MAQILLPPAHPRSRSALPSMVTLALWRGRRTWHLLLLAGLGIVAAVTLVCTQSPYTRPVRASTTALIWQLLPHPQVTTVNPPAKLGPVAAPSLSTVRNSCASGSLPRSTRAGRPRNVSATAYALKVGSAAD